MKRNFILLLLVFTLFSFLSINKVDAIIVEEIYSKNLAMPDLTGKTHLGDGVFRFKDLPQYTLDYNLNNGIFTYNSKTPHYLNDYIFTMSEIFPEIIKLSEDYYFTFYIIDNDYLGNIRFEFRSTGLPNVTIQNNGLINIITPNAGGFRIASHDVENPQNITFKLQLEIGSTATDYVVPVIRKFGVSPLIPYGPYVESGLINDDYGFYDDYRLIYNDVPYSFQSIFNEYGPFYYPGRYIITFDVADYFYIYFDNLDLIVDRPNYFIVEKDTFDLYNASIKFYNSNDKLIHSLNYTSYRDMFFQLFTTDDLGNKLTYRDGYNHGYITGEKVGQDIGIEKGKEIGKDIGYDLGYDDGFINGEIKGFNDGQASKFNGFSILVSGFWQFISAMFSISLLPGITIGNIAGFTMVFGLVFFIIGRSTNDGGKKK